MTGSSLRHAAAAIAVLTAAGAAAGCGSSGGAGGSAAPVASRTPGSSTTAAAGGHGPVSCPSSAGSTTPKWPAQLPADFPKPGSATQISGEDREHGVREAQFVVSRSLRDEVEFLLQKLPAAGYVLGHGDAEKDQADTPFVHDGLSGKIRLQELTPCTTQWIVVTVHGTHSTEPLLPSESDSPR